MAGRFESHAAAPPAGRRMAPPGQSPEVNGTILPLLSSRRVPNTLKHCSPAPVYAPPPALSSGGVGLPNASTASKTRVTEDVGAVVFWPFVKRWGFQPSK